MRVVLLNSFFPPPSYGGAETYVSSLAEALAARGWDVHVVTSGVTSRIERRGPVTVHRVTDFPPFPRLSTRILGYTFNPRANGLGRLFDRLRPDVTHIHNIHSTLMLYPLVRDLRSPIVAHLHDYWPVCNRGTLFDPSSAVACVRQNPNCCFDPAFRSVGSLNLRVKERLVRRLADRVEVFLSPSKFLATEMEKRNFPGAGKIQIIRHGIKVREAPRLFDEAPPTFVFAGRMVNYKNPMLGIRVMAQLARAGVEARLVLVGTGPMLPDLSRALEDAGIQHLVEIPGKSLPHSDVLTRIGRARSLILPSICYENSPMVIYEALSLGTPPVVTSRGGACELLEPGEDGFCADPTDEPTWLDFLSTLLSDGARWATMSQQAQSNARRKYSMDDHVKRIEAVYHSIT